MSWSQFVIAIDTIVWCTFSFVWLVKTDTRASVLIVSHVMYMGCQPATQSAWGDLKPIFYLFYDLLTHLSRDKMAAISQTIFSDAFSWMKSFIFWLKFHWTLFLRVLLTITQQLFRFGSDNGLSPNRRQAIIWTNFYPIHWRIYAALGGDETREVWGDFVNFYINGSSLE